MGVGGVPGGLGMTPYPPAAGMAEPIPPVVGMAGVTPVPVVGPKTEVVVVTTPGVGSVARGLTKAAETTAAIERTSMAIDRSIRKYF